MPPNPIYNPLFRIYQPLVAPNNWSEDIDRPQLICDICGLITNPQPQLFAPLDKNSSGWRNNLEKFGLIPTTLLWQDNGFSQRILQRVSSTIPLLDKSGWEAFYTLMIKIALLQIAAELAFIREHLPRNAKERTKRHERKQEYKELILAAYSQLRAEIQQLFSQENIKSREANYSKYIRTRALNLSYQQMFYSGIKLILAIIFAYATYVVYTPSAKTVHCINHAESDRSFLHIRRPLDFNVSASEYINDPRAPKNFTCTETPFLQISLLCGPDTQNYFLLFCIAIILKFLYEAFQYGKTAAAIITEQLCINTNYTATFTDAHEKFENLVELSLAKIPKDKAPARAAPTVPPHPSLSIG